MKTEPIRIESDRVQKVREHVTNTKQTISGFIALAIDDKLEKTNSILLTTELIEELGFEKTPHTVIGNSVYYKNGIRIHKKEFSAGFAISYKSYPFRPITLLKELKELYAILSNEF